MISIIPELGPFYTVTFDLFLNSIQDVRQHSNSWKIGTKGNILDFKQNASRVYHLMKSQWTTDKAPFKQTFPEESDECKFGRDSQTKRDLRWDEKTKNRLCIPPGKVPIRALRSFLTFQLWLPWNAESPELLVNSGNQNPVTKLEIKKWHKIEYTRSQLDKSNWQIVRGQRVQCYFSVKVNGKEYQRHNTYCNHPNPAVVGGKYWNVTIMSGNHVGDQFSFIPDMKMKNLKITNLPDIWPKKD